MPRDILTANPLCRTPGLHGHSGERSPKPRLGPTRVDRPRWKAGVRPAFACPPLRSAAVRVAPPASPASRAGAVQLSQMACRVAGHRSSPTDRPVEAVGAITDDTSTRRPTRHTFDITV